MDAALRARIKREAPAQGISPAENPAPGADVAPTNVQPVAGTNHGATAKAETSAAPNGDRRRRSRREPSSERAFSPLDNYRHKQRLAEGLIAVARGPRSSRAPRQTMLRKVVLDHGGNLYDGTIRKISSTGALIEGLWNVPVGTIFKLQISRQFTVSCTARWSNEDRMGVEFANPLQRNEEGHFLAVQGHPPVPVAKRANAA